MNERIRQLVKQAGIHFHKGGTLDAGPNGIAKFVLYSDIEKFAELIVRECVKVVDDMADPEDSERYFWAIQNASEKIKQHFGVEE